MAFDLLVADRPTSFRRVPVDECRGTLHLGRSDELLLGLVHSPNYLRALKAGASNIPEGKAVSVTEEPYLKKAWMTSDSTEAVDASVHLL